MYFDGILSIFGKSVTIKEFELERCNLTILCHVRFSRCSIGPSESTISDMRSLDPVKDWNTNFKFLLGYTSVCCSLIPES